MKIISTSPHITELLDSLGVLESVIASGQGTHFCDLDKSVAKFKEEDLEAKITELKPDIVITYNTNEESSFSLEQDLSESYASLADSPVKAFSYGPRTLLGIYDAFEGLGKAVGKKEQGQKLANMLRAEFKNWSGNFYDRMKNKKVVVLSGVEPLEAAGLWIPDFIHQCGAATTTMVQASGKDHNEIGWEQILAYKPDVILVAPRGMALNDALSTFKIMEKLSKWEDIPAVKRGEVFFTDGEIHFYRPTLKLRETMGILVSAIAGFDSGYITPRDSFQRLRWLEMQRHRFN